MEQRAFLQVQADEQKLDLDPYKEKIRKQMEEKKKNRLKTNKNQSRPESGSPNFDKAKSTYSILGSIHTES